jgi:hypothetical protein
VFTAAAGVFTATDVFIAAVFTAAAGVFTATDVFTAAVFTAGHDARAARIRPAWTRAAPALDLDHPVFQRRITAASPQGRSPPAPAFSDRGG